MKTLKQLTNVDKAGILHSCFPDEIPMIIDAIQGISESIVKNQAQERQTWTGGLLNFDFWLQLAQNAQTIISRYQKKLVTIEGSLLTSSLMAIKSFLQYIAWQNVQN